MTKSVQSSEDLWLPKHDKKYVVSLGYTEHEGKYSVVGRYPGYHSEMEYDRQEEVDYWVEVD